MAGLILLGLLALGVIVVVVMVITKQSNKRILQALGGSFVVIASFMLYTNYTCGPNSTDVKIMTPQAEAISNYILKNGIPESLSKIPDLPYPLEDCKKETHNYEQCTFYINTKKYNVDIYDLSGLSLNVYSWESETGIRYELEYSEQNNKWHLAKSNIAYSSKHDGICNPLRM
ncbi:hypothetical protein [Sulfurimonas sp.]|uniref:hypothetical protein n=1 Tax=Sulfurimonas sp. TaxID=2022749 RepID=UPI003D0F870E